MGADADRQPVTVATIDGATVGWRGKHRTLTLTGSALDRVAPRVDEGRTVSIIVTGQPDYCGRYQRTSFDLLSRRPSLSLRLIEHHPPQKELPL